MLIFAKVILVCINQNDLSEQSKQVSKMRTIYERAEEIFVWYGSSISVTG
jgi:hypothetical protein